MPNVRVVIRCRPHHAVPDDPTSHSVTSGHSASPFWQLDGTRRMILRSSSNLRNAGSQATATSSHHGGGGAAPVDKAFQFDHIYGRGEDQQTFFEAEVRPLLQTAMAQGAFRPPPGGADTTRSSATNAVDAASSSTGPVNVVLFAYGQTGSGKTHTVDGRRAAAQNGKKKKQLRPPSHPSAASHIRKGSTDQTEVLGAVKQMTPSSATEETLGASQGAQSMKESAEVSHVEEVAAVEVESSSRTRDVSVEDPSSPQNNDSAVTDGVRTLQPIIVTEHKADDTEADDDEPSHDDEEDEEENEEAMRSAQTAQRAGEGVAPRSLRHIFNTWETQRNNNGKHVTKWSLENSTSSLTSTINPATGVPPPSPSAALPMSPVSMSPAMSSPPPFEIVGVSVSFLEIYNERLFDLLNASCRSGNASAVRQVDKQLLAQGKRRRMPTTAAGVAAMHSTSLRLRRCADQPGAASGEYRPSKFEVENLTKLSCVDLDEALEYYYYGVSKKVFRAHNLNSQSSRAHSVFTIYVTYRDNSTVSTTTSCGGGGTALVDGNLDQAPLVVGEIAIVDLAGSERLTSILPQHNNISNNNSGSGNTIPGSPAAGTPRSASPLTSSNTFATFATMADSGRHHAALITESIHINKSLLTLGKVIMALSEKAAGGGGGAPPLSPATLSSSSTALNKRPSSSGNGVVRPAARHTPFRDSKLTMVMNHALGGNAIAVMVACVHLDPTQCNESVSTLYYATRTNRISNTVVSLEDPKTMRLKALAAEVASLKAELDTANGTIAALNALLLDAQQPRKINVGYCTKCNATTPSTHNNAPPTPIALDANRTRQPDAVARVPTDVTSPAAPVDEGVAPSTDSIVPHKALTSIHHPQQPPPPDMSAKLLEACEKLKLVLEANGRLRSAFDDERVRRLSMDRERETLQAENLALRDKLDLYDSLLLAQIAINKKMDDSMGGGGGVSKRKQEQRVPARYGSAAPRPAAAHADESSNLRMLQLVAQYHQHAPLHRGTQQSQSTTSSAAAAMSPPRPASYGSDMRGGNHKGRPSPRTLAVKPLSLFAANNRGRGSRERHSEAHIMPKVFDTSHHMGPRSHESSDSFVMHPLSLRSPPATSMSSSSVVGSASQRPSLMVPTPPSTVRDGHVPLTSTTSIIQGSNPSPPAAQRPSSAAAFRVGLPLQFLMGAGGGGA